MKSQNYSLSIAACDDQLQELEHIMEMTQAILQEKDIKYTMEGFQSAQALRDRFQAGEKFDLIMLDVMMPGEDGMELAGYLRNASFDGKIIFLSYNKELALQGYEVNASRYLSKPVERKQLQEALTYCLEQKQPEQEILVNVKGGIRRIFEKEIRYIETQGRGCRIFLEQEECGTNLRISELETMLSDRTFIRCHQGFLVNVAFIRGIRTGGIELLDGSLIPVSKYRIQTVRKKFLSYLEIR